MVTEGDGDNLDSRLGIWCFIFPPTPPSQVMFPAWSVFEPRQCILSPPCQLPEFTSFPSVQLRGSPPSSLLLLLLPPPCSLPLPEFSRAAGPSVMSCQRESHTTQAVASCFSLQSSPNSAWQCASSIRVPLSLPPLPHPLPLPPALSPFMRCKTLAGRRAERSGSRSRTLQQLCQGRRGEVGRVPLPPSPMYQEVADSVTQGLTEPCPAGAGASHTFPAALPTARQVRESSSFQQGLDGSLDWPTPATSLAEKGRAPQGRKGTALLSVLVHSVTELCRGGQACHPCPERECRNMPILPT